MLSIAINTIRRRAAAPLALNAAARRSSPNIFFVQNSSPLRGVNSHHCMSTSKNAYACDSPDGIHDLQDLEESSDWAKRIIDVSAVVENADAITATHESVLNNKQIYACDAPDGEHDLEMEEEHLNAVNSIINQASVLEDPNEVRDMQHRREEQNKKRLDTDFYNSKY
eukprot:1124_1